MDARSNLTESDIKAIVKETVRETFMQMGVDAADPIEVQKDFAHLRYWRNSTDRIKLGAWLAAAGTVVAGALGLIWTAITKGG